MLKKMLFDNDVDAIKFQRLKNRMRRDYELAKNEIDEDRNVSRSVVLGKIICFMRKRHQAGDNTPISLRKILISTNQNFLGWDVRYWLYNTAVPEHRKIDIVDDGIRFIYKPTYYISNFEELASLLKWAHDRNMEGILLDDVIESLPNAEKILDENASKFVSFKNIETRKVTLKYKVPRGQSGASHVSAPQHVPKYVPQKMPQKMAQKVSQNVPENESQNTSKSILKDMLKYLPENLLQAHYDFELSTDSEEPSTSAAAAAGLALVKASVRPLPRAAASGSALSTAASGIAAASASSTAASAIATPLSMIVDPWSAMEISESEDTESEIMDIDTEGEESGSAGVLAEYDASLDEYILPDFLDDEANP